MSRNSWGWRQRAAVLGCEGKWATTEEFVGIANDAFSPSPQAIALARRNGATSGKTPY
jgi:citrate lyase beta subunit